MSLQEKNASFNIYSTQMTIYNLEIQIFINMQFPIANKSLVYNVDG